MTTSLDLGRGDVLPQMSSRTEVLLCPILSPTPPCSRSGSPPCRSSPACWPLSAVAEAREADGGRWAATGRRCSCCAGSSMAPDWPSCTPTRATTIRTCGPGYASGPSPRASPAAALNPASGWAAPLVRRTLAGLVNRLPPADPPVRALRPAVHRISHPRRDAHLLQEAHHMRQALSSFLFRSAGCGFDPHRAHYQHFCLRLLFGGRTKAMSALPGCRPRLARARE
jgi:hypothetical protein